MNAYCSNGSCYCESGFEGNPNSGCTKIDPCDDVTEVSVPANAHCTSYYSTCSTKCSGWACDSGYTKDGNSCKKVCTAETCSGYGLSTCPSHGNCSTCTPVNTDCSTGSTKYKLDSCESGYTKSGNACICTAETCSGYSLSSCPEHGNCSSCTPKNTDCTTGSTKYKLDSCQSGYTLSGNTCKEEATEGKIEVMQAFPSDTPNEVLAAGPYFLPCYKAPGETLYNCNIFPRGSANYTSRTISTTSSTVKLGGELRVGLASVSVLGNSYRACSSSGEYAYYSIPKNRTKYTVTIQYCKK